MPPIFLAGYTPYYYFVDHLVVMRLSCVVYTNSIQPHVPQGFQKERRLAN